VDGGEPEAPSNMKMWNVVVGKNTVTVEAATEKDAKDLALAQSNGNEMIGAATEVPAQSSEPLFQQPQKTGVEPTVKEDQAAERPFISKLAKALGKSNPIAGMAAADVVKDLEGYKAGTLNQHGMGGVMKGQANMSADDMKALGEYISKLAK